MFSGAPPPATTRMHRNSRLRVEIHFYIRLYAMANSPSSIRRVKNERKKEKPYTIKLTIIRDKQRVRDAFLKQSIWSLKRERFQTELFRGHCAAVTCINISYPVTFLRIFFLFHYRQNYFIST